MQRPAKIALACVALWAATASPAVAGSASGNPAAVRLTIIESYDADKTVLDGGQVIDDEFVFDRRVRLPLGRLAARLLAHAGATTVDGTADDARAMLTIELHGTAMGQIYDYMENLQRRRSLRFAGARISGAVAFDTGTGRVCSARFFGAIEPPGIIPVLPGRDYRDHPAYAPFDDVLDRPGSFVAALVAVIGEIYGAAPLEALREEGGPRLARHADAALARLANTGSGGVPQVSPTVDCRGMNAMP